MPSKAETTKHIEFYGKIEPALKALELFSAQRMKEAQAGIKKTHPHRDNVVGMVREIVQRDPSLFGRHPLTAIHPELPDTHVLVVSPSRGLFCQSPINRELEFIRHAYPDSKTTTFTPVGGESHKLIDRIGGKSASFTEALKTLSDLQRSASILTDRVFQTYLRDGVGCMKLVYIQNSLEPRETQLLPIQFHTTDASTSRGKGLHVEGDSDGALDELFRMHVSTTIFHALLETRMAEHFSRMTTAHRGAENIEEILPELVLVSNAINLEEGTKAILELTQQL
jgi:ATP synthase F1 gamma subunit